MFAFVKDSVVTATPPAGGPITGAVEGLPLTAAVAAFTDTDTFGIPSDYHATIDWGDGSPQSAGTIVVDPAFGPGTGHFLVMGTHIYAEESTTGFTIHTTVTDNFGAQTGTTATVSAVADAPLVNPTGIPVSGTAGHLISNAPLGLFTDNNPLATASDFTATINWGDPNAPGADPIGFVALVGGSGTSTQFSVSGSHLYSKAGTYNITIAVQDDGGASTTIVTTVTVTASQISGQANPVVATEGLPTPANLPVATFTDLGAGPGTTFSVTVAWGDGTTDSNAPGGGVTVVNNGGGDYSVLAPPHTYADEGLYVLTVTISGSDGSGPIAPTNIAIVKDAPLSASNGGPFTVQEGSPLNATNAAPLATFTDANPKAPLSDFTATIDWGDGTITAGVITQPGGVGTVFDVLGGHTYVDDGSYTISVMIVNVGGSKANATASVTVTEATLTAGPQVAVQAYENSPLTNVTVTTFTSSSPFDTAGEFVATIDWGDGSPVSAGAIRQDAAGVFHVTGSHTYPDPGSFSVHVVIGEDDPTIVLDIPNAAIVTVSAVPLIVQPVPITATEGITLPNAQTVLNGTVVATYLDLGQADSPANYTATIDWGNGQVTPGTIVADGPNFAVLAPSNPLILYAEAGTYTVRVTVTDKQVVGGGFFSAYAFSTATVKDAPLTADPNQPVVSAFQQTPLVAVEVAKFTDGNPMAPLSDFTATIDWGDGTPQSAGSFIQPGGTGTAFYVTGNHTYANPTNPPNVPYTITVYIKDVDGSTLTTTTNANVQASTIIGTAVTINGVESRPLADVVVAYFSDTGIPGPLSSYSAMIDWGTGLPGAVTFGQIVPLGGNNFEVLGTYTYPEENIAPNLPYSVTVTIDHNGQLATTVVSHANIADAPLLGVAVPVVSVEGAAFTGTVGFFTDTDPNGMVSDYTATINWGDGTQSGGTVVASGAGFLVSAIDPISGAGHVYKEEGSYTFSVTVNDVGGASFAAFQTATVADAPLTSSGVTLGVNPVIYEWPAFSGVVATFTDADPFGQAPPVGTSDYIASINWGNGNTSIGTITQIATAPGAPTQFQVSGTNLFEEGTYSVSVVIRDNGGSNTVAFSTITVTDSPLTGGPPVPITAIEGNPFTAQVATFTDADALGVISDYAASINWGDGSTSAGILGQLANGTFTVTGTHTYAEETTGAPPNAVTVTIKDIGGATTTVNTTATVADAKLTSQGALIQAVEGITTGNILVATFTDANPMSTLSDFTTGNGSVTVNWGDGTPLYTVPPANITSVGSPTGVTYQVFAAHTYAETGSYQTIVTIKDTGGSATVANGEADVADAPLTTTGITQPTVTTDEAVIYPIPEFATPLFTGYVAEFNDTNPIGTVSDFRATIDWGDGSPRSTGTISQPGLPGTPFYVTGSHTYATSGVNGGVGHDTITVLITDEDGSTLTVSNTANVTDNPIQVAGILNPASDSGKSAQATISRTSRSRISMGPRLRRFPAERRSPSPTPT